MKKTLKKQNGQLTIFLGISLIVIITFLAFIINIGLFVKAKINLQNAVDAAAWAGAAVQSRQLSNIAYLNWEARNTYKEWMYKYYILGQKGLYNTNLSSLVDDPSGRMNFRTEPFYKIGMNGYDPNKFDKFNVPSICIHFGSPHDICSIYTIPGLPRFQAVGTPSISEKNESFLNAIVKEKAINCSERSQINFYTAIQWAYGTKKKIFDRQPGIAVDRVGAWPQALEVALRIRNLEMMVNLPPISEISLSGCSNCKSPQELDQSTKDTPLYERPIKAFWSAFRNLGGGSIKSKNRDELSSSFKLTELEPQSINPGNDSLSGFLIPSSATIGDTGESALKKRYLDLQVYPLNLVTFYSTFVTATGKFKNTNIPTEAKCVVSKTALPVPGYIFGFVKNPEVLTYYAVKGETKFIGLFFPFEDIKGITIKAYSAAKPFGGRIGPMLFNINTNSPTIITPRINPSRSSSYVSSVEALTPKYQDGDPIPKANFWAKTTAPIGGSPLAIDPAFVIPNLLYDFDNISDIVGQDGGSPIETLTPALNESDSRNIKESKGLYNAKQFYKFSSNTVNPTAGTVFSAEEVKQSIENVRMPTKYEALNYMIPTIEDGKNSNNLESAQEIVIEDGKNGYKLYGPLFGENTLYNNLENIKEIMSTYLDFQQKAVRTFTNSLREVSQELRNNPTRGGDSYIEAAEVIYKPVHILDDCNKLSIAQKFHIFFSNSGTKCGIIPLVDQMSTYLSDSYAENKEIFRNFYRSTYNKRDDVESHKLMTAFMPGPRQGAGIEGVISRPFSSITNLGKRNYYSTKFVALDKLIGSGSPHSYGQISAYIENKTLTTPPDVPAMHKNTIITQKLLEFKDFYY